MDISLPLLLGGLFTLAVGAVLGYIARQSIAKNQLSTAEAKAARIVEDGQKQAAQAVLEAKNKAVGILEDAKKQEAERAETLARAQERLDKRESALDQKLEEVDKTRTKLEQKAEEIRAIQDEAVRLRDEEAARLEKIAGLSKDEAKDTLFKVVEEQNRDVLATRVAKLEHESQDQIEQKALSLMAQAVQRYSRSHISEFTTTTVQLPSDEVKGKIIGKEGRNIRSLERLTGVELIVDDTPETVLISGFDPVRREVARLALEALIKDGRIHPARIEEAVEEAKKEVDQKIKEAGEAAAYECGIPGLHPKLLYILGRLKYRYSYKQNVLLHSIEMAFVAGALAAELGANVMVAKKGALLHDIGKAVDHEIEGTHVKIGMRILEKFGVEQAVIDAMKSHHDEFPHTTIEAFIVTAADAISAARPGARKETAEKYIKRMEELEALVNSFPAVEKSYAIQAGREVRIFVNPEKTDDLGAIQLAKDVAKRIQEELKYPGEIRVLVFRETRAVEIAR